MSLTLGLGTEFTLPSCDVGDRLEKTLKHQEPTSHASEASVAHDHAHRAHLHVGEASCCSAESAPEAVKPPSLAAAAAGGCCGSVAKAPGTGGSALKDPV